MRSRKPVWLALFLILWLPLQGFALPLMPFCKHGHPQEQTALADHCQHPTVDPGQDTQDPHALDCDGCSLCHLASVSAPVSAPPEVAGLAPFTDLPPYLRFYRSHIPERLQRPPLAPLA